MVRHIRFEQMKSKSKSVPGYSNSSGKQRLRKCSTSGEDGDLVLIDVDSDVPDVIIVDVPESVQKTLRKPSPRTVISIDDDDDVDKVLGEDCAVDDDPSPSHRCSPKPNHSSVSAKGSGKDYSFFCERNSRINLSNPKRTYSGKTGSRNRYGLGSEDESGSAESDCSDCECIDGPSEMIREQWELASQRRKAVTNSIRSGFIDTSTSSSLIGDHSEPGLVITEEQLYVSDQCNPTCAGNVEDSTGEENSPSFTEHAFGSSLIVEDKCDHVAQALAGAGNAGKQSYVPDHSDPICVGVEKDKEKEKSSSFTENAFGNPQNYDEKAGTMGAESSYKENNSSKDAENSDKPDLRNFQPFFDEHMCSEEREPTEEELAAFWDMMSKHDFEAEREELMATLKTLRDRQKANSECSSRHFVRMEAGGCDQSEPTEKESAAFRDMMSKYDFASEHEETMATLETLKKQQKTCLDYLSRHLRRTDESTRKPSNDSTFSKTDVVTDRQKLKETDEYKRAMEELQESRQQQLKIQAEEAQRLRRRKRAETMRLMDMERRQKRRLEEVRETQKKDEQDLNMKEKIRAGIRKELSHLEKSCGDMASLLRRLGVNINGDLVPPKNEVLAAYKRALLMFHPDRASRTDIRQQVEAEEKFKLVSRMKEKLLSS